MWGSVEFSLFMIWRKLLKVFLLRVTDAKRKEAAAAEKVRRADETTLEKKAEVLTQSVW